MKNAQPSAMHVNRFTAAKVLALGAVGVLLYVAHAAFIPVALALLFALVLSGPVEALHRLRVPRGLSAAVILIVVLMTMGGGIDLMWGPAQQWFKSAPQTVRVVKRKLAPAAKFVGHIEALRETASVIGAAVPATAVATDKDSAPVLLWDATREAAVSTVTFIIITLFLLAGGPPCWRE